MASIFLSYAHEDKARAEVLAKALEAEGWSVFWDRTIPTGSTWRDYIGRALHEARCVVVAWSKASITSDWVHEEADEGRERKILVPVLLENVKPPLGFRSIQAETLTDWNGSPSAGEFRKLVVDIEKLLSPPPNRQFESTKMDAASAPQEQPSTASLEYQQKVRPTKPTTVQPSQSEHAGETGLADKYRGAQPAAVPKAAIYAIAAATLALLIYFMNSIEWTSSPDTEVTERDACDAPNPPAGCLFKQ